MDSLGVTCMHQHTGHVPARAGCKEEAELNNLLKSCVMVRRLKRQVLQQLPPKRRTQARRHHRCSYTVCKHFVRTLYPSRLKI
jgi:hypothetical protein